MQMHTQPFQILMNVVGRDSALQPFQGLQRRSLQYLYGDKNLAERHVGIVASVEECVSVYPAHTNTTGEAEHVDCFFPFFPFCSPSWKAVGLIACSCKSYNLGFCGLCAGLILHRLQPIAKQNKSLIRVSVVFEQSLTVS